MGRRVFLLLQGPPGPLFRQLGAALRERGHGVHRINLSGGDHYDWPEGAIAFRGRFSDWPVYLDNFLRANAVTDLVLFGDCRPYHVTAHGIAGIRGVRTHVLEEGYLRPDWMTLELEGVNARSPIKRSKAWILSEARRLPPEPQAGPITASFRRRARDSYWHYHHVVTGRLRFPHYRTHRQGSIIGEGLGWLWKFLNAKRRTRAAEATLAGLEGKPYFVLPLQLSGDFQIRAHSAFTNMQGATAYVLSSFAKHAPGDVHLLLKAHPLDCSFYNWPGFVRRHAKRLGIDDRVHYVDGGDLDEMVEAARGLVCVNSTSATIALARDVAVCTIGEAIYDIPGLTHQGHLDAFWENPKPPEPGLYPAFRKVLVNRSLVRGGLASESAVTTLIGSMVERFEQDSGQVGDGILYKQALS